MELPKVAEGRVWQYQIILRSNGEPTHQWSLKSEKGGIHINAFLNNFQDRKEWLGGIECHWPKDAPNLPEYYKGEKPHHEQCWLLGEPCWHDGSSLNFSENVAPMLPDPYGNNCHDMSHCHTILDTTLWDWFRTHIEPEPEIEPSFVQ